MHEIRFEKRLRLEQRYFSTRQPQQPKPAPIARAARTKEDSMKADLYVRILLTIVAGCLMMLTFQRVTLMPRALAATSTTCTGEMKATSAGPIQASIGSSYKIEVTCN
jgi:hypothetical protein